MKIESSSTSYVNGNYSNKGFSGLASGVDTESMVKEMLSGLQSKIDKQQGLKQQTQWKQDLYRSVIQDIHDFKGKYFDRLATGNLMDSSLFSAMTATSSSPAVKVTATTDAASGFSKIEVAQLASATSIKSMNRVSGPMSGTLDITKLAAETEDGKLLMPTEGSLSLEVKLNGVKKTVTVDLARLAKEAGLEGVDLNDSSNASKLSSANKALAAAIQKGIQQVHGTSIRVAESGGKITLSGSDFGQEISIGGSDALLGAIGMKSGQSNKIYGWTALKDINFAKKLSGDRFTFSINGREFSYSGDTMLNQIISDINGSDAGVRITFNSVQDIFNIESTSTGKGIDIEMSQSEGNLLTAMFGGAVNAGNTVTRGVSLGDIAGGTAEDGFPDSGTFTLTVNGSKKTIRLTELTEDNIVEKLNAALEGQLGNQDIQLEKDSDGKYTLKVAKGIQVSFDGTEETDLAAKLGFAEKNNLVGKDDDPTLGELGILAAGATISDKGGSFTIDADTKLSELDSKSGGRYSFDTKTGRIVLTSEAGTRELSESEKAVFGDVALSNGQKFSGLAASGAVTAGKNAVVNIDGVWTERSTNGFTVNGLYLELKDTTGEYEMDGDEVKLTPSADGSGFEVKAAADAKNTPVTLESSRDTEKIYTRITDFVNDYNALIEKLNGYVDEEASYREYAPLTSDQKKEMSDREIELWEEKAKEGLLRRDSAITTFLSDMRTALYQRPSGSSIALYDIGIDTSSEWRDKGKLQVNETALRAAIEQNPTEVMSLFTASDGLSAKMAEAIKRAANDSSGSPGTLVQIAGMKNRGTDKNNELYERMRQIDQQITRLQNQYSQQKARYWNQFNTMEQMISNMNTQSAWLAQMLG